MNRKRTVIDFFAGSGLASLGLSDYFSPVWANDISEKKAKVYTSNHDTTFILDSIENIKGKALPVANLLWGSFPCQDLSLAGRQSGINGKRSGLFWEWIRVIDELTYKPQTIVA